MAKAQGRREGMGLILALMAVTILMAVSAGYVATTSLELRTASEVVDAWERQADLESALAFVQTVSQDLGWYDLAGRDPVRGIQRTELNRFFELSAEAYRLSAGNEGLGDFLLAPGATIRAKAGLLGPAGRDPRNRLVLPFPGVVGRVLYDQPPVDGVGIPDFYRVVVRDGRRNGLLVRARVNPPETPHIRANQDLVFEGLPPGDVTTDGRILVGLEGGAQVDLAARRLWASGRTPDEGALFPAETDAVQFARRAEGEEEVGWVPGQGWVAGRGWVPEDRAALAERGIVVSGDPVHEPLRPSQDPDRVLAAQRAEAERTGMVVERPAFQPVRYETYLRRQDYRVGGRGLPDPGDGQVLYDRVEVVETGRLNYQVRLDGRTVRVQPVRERVVRRLDGAPADLGEPAVRRMVDQALVEIERVATDGWLDWWKQVYGEGVKRGHTQAQYHTFVQANRDRYLGQMASELEQALRFQLDGVLAGGPFWASVKNKFWHPGFGAMAASRDRVTRDWWYNGSLAPTTANVYYLTDPNNPDPGPGAAFWNTLLGGTIDGYTMIDRDTRTVMKAVAGRFVGDVAGLPTTTGNAEVRQVRDQTYQVSRNWVQTWTSTGNYHDHWGSWVPHRNAYHSALGRMILAQQGITYQGCRLDGWHCTFWLFGGCWASHYDSCTATLSRNAAATWIEKPYHFFAVHPTHIVWNTPEIGGHFYGIWTRVRMDDALRDTGYSGQQLAQMILLEDAQRYAEAYWRQNGVAILDREARAAQARLLEQLAGGFQAFWNKYVVPLFTTTPTPVAALQGKALDELLVAAGTDPYLPAAWFRNRDRTRANMTEVPFRLVLQGDADEPSYRVEARVPREDLLRETVVTIPESADGGQVLYIPGRVTWLGGTVEGRLTIVSEGEVHVTGEIRYAEEETGGEPTSILGVVGRDGVLLVPEPPSMEEALATGWMRPAEWSVRGAFVGLTGDVGFPDPETHPGLFSRELALLAGGGYSHQGSRVAYRGLYREGAEGLALVADYDPLRHDPLRGVAPPGFRLLNQVIFHGWRTLGPDDPDDD